jgi:hypothetical protein
MINTEIQAHWDEDTDGSSVLVLGYVSDDYPSLAPLDGCWSRESFPELAALAASLGVKIYISEEARYVE